ncbi:hypothetical protein BLA9940_04886 [Burkholderia aenigmatica]|uniref:hypothetical protein n=1 Tax=Burkholderia cepacia complex TaxID=87882 RepID=UPI000F08C29F|nr:MULTISPECIES: hypothetical protein [Burkholderia cepacia complex]AYQ36810.1 hypothetical protein CVS37_00840 [Burkholderia lata]VWC82206.1 hypothetical protein BLA9940_04886 [Burkholderia aenigmatica]
MFGKSKRGLSFEEGITRWLKRSDMAPMQAINVAMWKGDAEFENDISDRELFNERFIETRFGDGTGKDIIYLLSMQHTIFTSVMAISVFTGDWFWELLLIYPIVNILFFWGMWALTKPSTRIRFNRQAQRVHIVDREGLAITLYWRDVQPIFRLMPPGRIALQLAFPPPVGVTSRVNDGVLWLNGEFDKLDSSNIRTAALRFEFIRRYMAEGLDAIQPTADLDMYREPSPPSRLNSFYWPGLGPLIDRWANYHLSKFRWPEEVERLCAPGADLSGCEDTTPVVANKQVFYRIDPRDDSFYACNLEGQRLMPSTENDHQTSTPSPFELKI